MGKIYLVHASGNREVRESDTPLTREEVQAFVGGDIEYVQVLFEEAPCYMLVNEIGALPMNNRGPLPINAWATDVYHNAMRARGKDWIGPPFIHGDIVLYQGIPL